MRGLARKTERSGRESLTCSPQGGNRCKFTCEIYHFCSTAHFNETSRFWHLPHSHTYLLFTYKLSLVKLQMHVETTIPLSTRKRYSALIAFFILLTLIFLVYFLKFKKLKYMILFSRNK